MVLRPRALQWSLAMVVLLAATAAQADIKPKAERGPRDLVIVAGGDTAWPRGWFVDLVEAQKDRFFEQVQPIVAQSDLAFLNLETPLTRSWEVVDKRYKIVTHPKALDWCLDAGFNMFSLANNHTADAGDAGIEDTLDTMEAARAKGRELWWAGASRKIGDVWRPTFITPPGKDLTIAFLAFGESGETTKVPSWRGNAPLRAIRKAARKADLVVVSIHSGKEYFHHPEAKRARRHRAFVDAGADIVLGHHPHVVQGVEAYKEGLIFHSLGNLSFASMTNRHRRRRTARLFGILPMIEIRSGEVVRAEIVPLYVNNRDPWTLGSKTLEADPFVPQVLDDDFGTAVIDALHGWTAEVPGIAPEAVEAFHKRGPRALVQLSHRHIPEGAAYFVRESREQCPVRQQRVPWPTMRSPVCRVSP